MISRSPGLRKRLAIYALSIAEERSASFFRPLGRDSGEAEQGINAHGGVIDELHVIEDRESIDNIETSMAARRQPVLVKITTAGKKRASVWWEERSDAISVVEGRATDDSMLVLVYTLDEGDDPFDEAVWPKANPNLDVSLSTSFLREQAARAKRSPGKLAGFLQLNLNVPTQQSVKAIDIDLWDTNDGRLRDDLGNPVETYEEFVERVAPAGSVGFGGIDLASVQDLTAVLDVFRDDDGFANVVARFYCPAEGIERRSRHDGVPYEDWVRDGFLVATPGNVTDYDRIREDRKTDAERWELRETGFDRWNATQLMTQLSDDGATCIAVPQTYAGLAPGWRELERLLLEKKLRHGGHPILRWMAGNVEVETDPAGNQRPSKGRSSERIDGIVALDMAISRLIVHQAELEVDAGILLGRARASTTEPMVRRVGDQARPKRRLPDPLAPFRSLVGWWNALAPEERVLYRALVLLGAGSGLVYAPLALIVPGAVLALTFFRSRR